ncbi:MAG TPA: sigma-70 family RNA polymerase sigma factor [Actinophytocola sp.]|uniref:sigma-70 family RNA polymerase sigma factor n=1 Tax=Actinophytocola sp. TaxID=1872138 RepID=UPI002DDCE6B1|nr:sigma-70 family RNA polymerase sigma factor [Actinophytocola sp.]HEV2779244.1 sigma-70 family RNA polymerase sigma factor [Actinophytocola sp.]
MTDVPRGAGTPPPANYEEEFTHAYRALKPFLHRYVLVRYCRFQADVADEIVSDIFFKAWHHWHEVRLIPDPIPWFLTTAKNAAIDYWRRKNKDIPVEPNESDVVLVSRAADADTRLELLNSLEAMGTLPERMRDALAQWCAGWTQQEIAEVMSLKETTISEYVKKARDRVARSVGRSRTRKRGRHRARQAEPPHHRENRPDREDQS